MNIFEYYVSKHEDPNWVQEYQSTSDKKSGKTFLYTNTNVRTIRAFIEVYSRFLDYNNLPREQWVTYANGEQMAKHYTVRMQQTKLFRQHDDRYTRTAKGEVFGKLVEHDRNGTISNNDEWILIYYLILNSYFGYKPNYIVKRTQEVYNTLASGGYSPDEVNAAFEKVLIKKDDITINDLFTEDAFWILTFFKDKDFLLLYKNSDQNAKNKLFNRVMHERSVQGSTDLIGHKYVNSGQFNASMIIDEMCVLYITYNMLQRDNKDCLILLDNICSVFEKIGEVDRHFLSNFLTSNTSIFEEIFNEVILNEDIDDEINKDETDTEEQQTEENPPATQVDTTTSISRQLLRHTRAILKRMTKDRAQHKCELEVLNTCKYFTSKEDNNNYLEIHHLIPWAFSNDFENSLEHIDNYVALCPSCHMLLHHGTDRERKQALTYLFNQRKDKLKSAGLEITLERLFEYYQIEA